MASTALLLLILSEFYMNRIYYRLLQVFYILQLTNIFLYLKQPESNQGKLARYLLKNADPCDNGKKKVD